jgi:hypothetical protein
MAGPSGASAAGKKRQARQARPENQDAQRYRGRAVVSWHLAQVNIGIAKYTYEDPRFAEFVDNLERINTLAESAPGFVWRYVQDDEYEAGRDVFGYDAMLFNMSLWNSKKSLMDYVYKSAHVDILRRRAEWFVPLDRPILALWWQPAGTIPTVVEAKHRLERLQQSGPTQDAFTFRRFFPAPQIEEKIHG